MENDFLRSYVLDLMDQLFTWLEQSKYHPLVKSSIFHYEFEFMLGMIRNALKGISETYSRTNVAINVGINVATNKGKIIRHGSNKNGYWEVIN